MTTTPTTGLLAALSSDADETMSWVTHAARDTVAGVDYVTITVVADDRSLSSVGSTDPLALSADSLQYSLRQGPTMAVLRGELLVRSSDLRADLRWADYGSHLQPLGIRAQTALALRWSDQTVGALNLYSTGPETLTVDALALARQYAAQAAKAWETISSARREAMSPQRQGLMPPALVS
ncbi:MAG: GAF domain-containing protein [Nocardioidaceae bacterium]|nr:GAF domain-containing protein [Nocardioidaceae bacterium]